LNPPLVDFERLEEVCMADREAMNDLLSFFFDQAEGELATLNQAIAASDAELVCRSAHRLVGASAGCGLSGLVAPLRELEQHSQKGDLSMAGTLYTTITSLLTESRAEIDRWNSAGGS